jgi:hypothetical protein
MLLDGGARVLVTGRSQAGLESAQKEIGKDALVVSSDARSLGKKGLAIAGAVVGVGAVVYGAKKLLGRDKSPENQHER